MNAVNRSSVRIRRSRPMRRVAAAVCAGSLAMLALVGPMGGADAASNGGAVTKTVTASRTHLIRGSDIEVDVRDVSVTVSQTQSLRDRQAIKVTWQGAHPTGGVVADRNSSSAAQQEYPVVVLQCRGLDSTTAAKALNPTTCWTSDPEERAKSSSTFLWPPYRVDRYATAPDRQQVVGVPDPIPAACGSAVAGAQHWIPFIGTDGTVYGGGPFSCAGIAPEAGGGSITAPSNTTYGVTDLAGNGSSNFVINTVDSNASLGCSETVPCSLVVVPIMGISCDTAAADLPVADQPAPKTDRDSADLLCQKQGYYAPGAQAGGGVDVEDLSVSGQLWWSASNWRNRLSFPLSFAQPANVCDLVSNDAPTFVYGSQALVQATQQWGPGFCLNPKLFKFQHVQFSEPGSRNLLDTGSIKAAFSAGPPDHKFTKPIVQAPLTVSGFAIGMRLDNADGQEVAKANLTPRLLAKMLTMSYAGLTGVQASYPELATNPIDIVADPEFRALNPNMMTSKNAYDGLPASTLYAMASDSDVMAALTSYINADPDARAWLDGAADPWGMKVNPTYKGISLPVDSWPQLDGYVYAYAATNSPCFASNPLPWLPLVAAPVSNPATVTLNMQFGLSNSQIICKDAGQPNQKLTSVGRVVPGRRALFGLISVADAERYQIPMASLLSHTTAGAAKAFTDSSGRTFVAPTSAGMAAAAKLFKPDMHLGTWPIPYAALRGDAGKQAYPGTLLMSIDVPTQGLSSADASRYATLVRSLSTSGQVPGLGNGQLAPGYLPLTAAHGLGALAAYSQSAAAAIQAQAGFVPAVDGSQPTPSPVPTPTASSTPDSSGGAVIPTTGPSATPDPGTSTPAATPTPSPLVSITAVATGSTADLTPGMTAGFVPVLAAIALLAGLVALILSRRRPA